MSMARITKCMIRSIRISAGGSPTSLTSWHSAFYRLLKEQLASGSFVGKDQSTMAATCLEVSLPTASHLLLIVYLFLFLVGARALSPSPRKH